MTTLVDYLARSADRAPDHVAVAHAGTSITYRELDIYSDVLAARLVRAGARPGERVVIGLPAGIDLVVSVWAVLKTGAAYVPIDSHSPPARRDLIIERIKPTAVIAAPHPTYGDRSVDVRFAYEEKQEPFARRNFAPGTPAYILHTSGSTGVPKGVVLTHRNATAFVDWAVDEFAIMATDRIAGHAPAHFDLSTLDLFGAAKASAALMPVPTRAKMFGAELARFIQDTKITLLYCVPTALTMLSQSASEENLISLRRILFAGEVCPPATLRTMASLTPGAAYTNLYGPTETNVCTFHHVTAPDRVKDSVPMGRPISGVRTWIEPSEGQEGRGELVVAGPTVAVGYWEDPEQTSKRFLELDDGRGYRTGDVVIQDAQGVLHFRGRSDRQVKTRGHRVELDEVESILRSHPAIEDAAVFAVADHAMTNLLIAAVTSKDATITSRQIRKDCARQLPAYAIPTAVSIMREFPLTSTGKVDRIELSNRLAITPSTQPVTNH
ncbi:MAG: amino acid adenylation domain-containing protein [Corynebacteriales bacterium]|nr:amino acid adenylation domain-containing protein [Mycobacteriales bacterium]